MNRCGPLIDGNLIQSRNSRCFSFSFFLQFTGCDQLAQGPYGAVTERWAKLSGYPVC